MDKETLILADKFPSLTSNQMEKCREYTRKLMLNIIGESAPQLEDFTQYVGEPPDESKFFLNRSWLEDIRSIAIPTDYLMIPILLIMLAISLVHMLEFSGSIATLSWSQASEGFEGLSVSFLAWVLVHQVGLFGMSELGVILFYTANSMEYNRLSDEDKANHSKFRNMNFYVAVAFALMTIIANVSSLLHNLVGDFDPGQAPTIAVLASIGLLIPIVTMFLGERFAQLLLQVIETRKERSNDYEEERSRYYARLGAARVKHDTAMEKWSRFHSDETTHPKYLSKFAAVIADYYKRNVKYYEDGQSYTLPKDEWTPILERSLAAREISNMKRMEDIDSAVNFFSEQVGEQ